MRLKQSPRSNICIAGRYWIDWLRAFLIMGITQSCFQKNQKSNSYEGGGYKGFGGGGQILDFFRVKTVSLCFSGRWAVFTWLLTTRSYYGHRRHPVQIKQQHLCTWYYMCTGMHTMKQSGPYLYSYIDLNNSFHDRFRQSTVIKMELDSHFEEQCQADHLLSLFSALLRMGVAHLMTWTVFQPRIYHGLHLPMKMVVGGFMYSCDERKGRMNLYWHDKSTY